MQDKTPEEIIHEKVGDMVRDGLRNRIISAMEAYARQEAEIDWEAIEKEWLENPMGSSTMKDNIFNWFKSQITKKSKQP